jgi:hypothetical protein
MLWWCPCRGLQRRRPNNNEIISVLGGSVLVGSLRRVDFSDIASGHHIRNLAIGSVARCSHITNVTSDCTTICIPGALPDNHELVVHCLWKLAFMSYTLRLLSSHLLFEMWSSFWLDEHLPAARGGKANLGQFRDHVLVRLPRESLLFDRLLLELAFLQSITRQKHLLISISGPLLNSLKCCSTKRKAERTNYEYT